MGEKYLYARDQSASGFIGAVRWTTLIASLPLALYATFAAFEMLPRSPLFTVPVSAALVAMFFVLAVWQFLTKDYSSKAVLIRLSAFHLVAGLYLLFVSSVASPVVFCWLLLATIGEVFFARRGLVASLFVLLCFVLLSISIGDTSDSALVNAFTMYFYIAICAVFTTVLRSTTRKEHAELEQARAHQESDRGQLLTLLNSISVGILSVNPDGIIHMYNAAFLGLLDTNDSLLGKKIAETLKLYDKEGNRVELMSIVEKSYQAQRDDLVLRYEDGDEIRLGILINPIRTKHNKLSGYICIIEDITKEKSLEEERDEFISIISHELRTPITISEGSISNAQLLLDRNAGTEVLKQTFKEAHNQIVYLANMVNDLGTLSRAERGIGDDMEEIDIDTLARELYSKYSPRADAKKLHFNLNVVGHIGRVVTSRLYLEEILQNFITNSIKYTQEGSVTLTIRRTQTGVYFGVKDTGIGISKADQKRIFEKFYRSEDYRTRETSGTGLGLYVVQKLAHKLGVSIEIESRLNHGSTFSFVLTKKER